MKPGLIVILAASAMLLAGCSFGRSAPPKSAKLDVPFTSQAPAGNWSEPWKNACEETSIYMVSSFYADDEIKRDAAIKKIREIMKVKNEAFAVSKDESLAAIARLIEELGLPWTTEIILDPTVDGLKAELAAGRPIIVPVHAPELGNPYYGGPVNYHVLVLVGYDDKDGVFIVNDPGTKSGKGLRFTYDVFMKAIHDLNPGDQGAGKKAVLATREKTDWEKWMEGIPAGP
jgi:uncharacterized protein YvpB